MFKFRVIYIKMKNIVLFFKRIFISIVLAVFSLVIPKNKKIWVFGGYKGEQFSGNTKAMFLYILRNENIDIEVFYFTRNEKILKLNIPNIVKIGSLKSYLLLLRAYYIFTDSDFYDVVDSLGYMIGRFNIIDLWHGEGPKKIGFTNKQSSYMEKIYYYTLGYIYYKYVVKYGFLSSKYMCDMFSRGRFNNNKYLVTGAPRNDTFFFDILEYYDVEKKYNLKKYNKIILYAPTWRGNNKTLKPFSEHFLDIFSKFLVEKNYLFIIKAHPLSNSILGSKTYKNIVDISKDLLDIQELLKYADILITDYSSIFVDFLLLKRPIIFYAYDLDEYIHNLVELRDEYEKTIIPSSLIKKENELITVLKNQKFFIGDQYLTEYNTLLNFYHKYKSGGAIKRILKILNG